MSSRAEKKLDRQIKNYLLPKTEFFEALEAMRCSAKDMPDAQENLLELLDKFPEFFASVIETYEQYESKNKMALRNLDLSSQELNVLNIELQFLNSSMAAILENLGVALVFFDAEGICSPVFSKSCLEVFNCDPGHQKIWDVLKFKEKDIKSFQNIMKFSFENTSAMSFDDMFKMAPSLINTEEQFITLHYRPIYDSAGKLKNILVIASDETETQKTKEILEEKERHTERIIRLAYQQDNYIQVLSDLQDYFADSNMAGFKHEPSIQSLKGHLHTLKGLAGSFFMENIVEIIHRLEDEIIQKSLDYDQAKAYLKTQRLDVLNSIQVEISFAQNILGGDFLNKRNAQSIKNDKLFGFYDFLAQKDPEIAEKFFTEFLETPLFDALGFLNIHLEQTARKTDKKVFPCTFTGENILIPLERYDEILQSFTHIIRNAVYHGIESPEMRSSKGKDEHGKITVHAETFVKDKENWLRISFADDGRGIDTKAIEKILKEKGKDTDKMSETEIINSIFEDDFSSARTVSNLAGRGVGLFEAKHQIEKLNGMISVETAENSTTFVVEFPMGV